jgi:hypothetical protein
MGRWGSALNFVRRLPNALGRNHLSLAIFSLIQLAMAPRLMVRSPKSLAVTLAE